MRSTHFVRKMGVWEILGTGIALYCRNFGKLTLSNFLVILMSIPAYLVFWLVIGGLFGGAIYLESSVAMVAASLAYIVVLLLFTSVLTLVNASVFVLASDIVLARPIRIGPTFRRVFSGALFGRLLSANIRVTLTIMLGYLLFIIPGFIFTVRYAFTTYSIIIEMTESSEAMKRSRELVEGNGGRVFGFLSAATFLFVIALYLPAFLIFGVFGDSIGAVLAMIWFTLGIVVGSGMLSLSNTLLYYDLRVRNDNYSEELLMEEMGFMPLEEMMAI